MRGVSGIGKLNRAYQRGIFRAVFGLEVYSYLVKARCGSIYLQSLCVFNFKALEAEAGRALNMSIAWST